jgi:hypothetical protein
MYLAIEFKNERFQTPLPRRWDAFGFPHDCHPGESYEELLKPHLSFKSRERRADTEVVSPPECQVMPSLTMNVEAIRVVKLSLIETCRTPHQVNERSRGNFDAV